MPSSIWRILHNQVFCIVLIFRKSTEKKNLMIRSYNKVHVSNRTKRMLLVVWNFQMKTLLKGKKIPRNVSIHRRRSHNTKILTTSGWVTAAACDGYKKWCGFKAFILSSLLRFFCKIKGSLIQTSMKNGLCNIQGAGVWQTPQASH